MFYIGIYHPKYSENIGTLMRSAYQLGADGVFTIGKRYQRQAGDIFNFGKHLPIEHFDDWLAFKAQMNSEFSLIAVEKGGVSLSGFEHPQNAIYCLGAEDYGLPRAMLDDCKTVVSLDAIRQPMYNVAVAGSIIMYDRMCIKKTGD